MVTHHELGRAPRITSWGIIAETYTWLRYHVGYRAASRWLDETAALEARGVLNVIYPDATSEAGIRRTLTRFADQDLSYVDAFTLVAVETHGRVGAIFAFDHDLTLAGLPVVPGVVP